MELILEEGESAAEARDAVVIRVEMKGVLYGRVSTEEIRAGEESETGNSED